jgi:hypothetical protein
MAVNQPFHAFPLARALGAFTPHSVRSLNCFSNLIDHDHPTTPADGGGKNGFCSQGRRTRKRASQQQEEETGMFQGHIDRDGAAPVDASAIPDVLFERGLYWASGRSGVVNLVAAHKWFNLAALKGRTDAIPLRREVAEMMSEFEIAMAQREARAWMSAA